ncbi:MAG: energy-coupled thiamine transporter ThiT [Oscillospiraceae bacterium]|nr:energy-coupled thiamine transporter ThiT [Oscillospiraceae bacterium]
MKNTKVLVLAECAIMLGLSIALSFVKVWKMPMGGSVTLLSMLPLILISVKYGIKIGLPVAFLYAGFQFGVDIGEVMTWGMTPGAIVGMSVLDYLIPFTGLGLAGVFRYKKLPGWCAGIAVVMVLRFAGHFTSGIIIFGQWAPEDWNVALYSLVYNGAYMLPELIFTMLGAIFLLKTPHVRTLFSPV